jgi:jouberin
VVDVTRGYELISGNFIIFSFSMMTRYIGANNFKEHVRSTMSTCGSFVFSGSEDGLVYVWDTETGNPRIVFVKCIEMYSTVCRI